MHIVIITRPLRIYIKCRVKTRLWRDIAGSWSGRTPIKRWGIILLFRLAGRFPDRLLSLVYEEDAPESFESGTGA